MMNRRSMFKAAISACAVVLFPRRKAKAKSSWGYFVATVPSKNRYRGSCEQTKRIERLLEVRCGRCNWSAIQECSDGVKTVAYETTVYRRIWRETTAVLWASKFNEAVAFIDDSVANSMSDGELASELNQAFLWSLYKKTPMRIAGVSVIDKDVLGEYDIVPTEENTG